MKPKPPGAMMKRGGCLGRALPSIPLLLSPLLHLPPPSPPPPSPPHPPSIPAPSIPPSLHPAPPWEPSPRAPYSAGGAPRPNHSVFQVKSNVSCSFSAPQGERICLNLLVLDSAPEPLHLRRGGGQAAPLLSKKLPRPRVSSWGRGLLCSVGF